MKQSQKKVPGVGSLIPPIETHVLIYFEQLGKARDVAEQFYQQCSQLNWHYTNGHPVRDWKAYATAWIRQQERKTSCSDKKATGSTRNRAEGRL